MLCSKGAGILQTKSLCVQEAANELIEMLCEVQEEDEMAEDDHRDHGEFRMSGKQCRHRGFTATNVC